MDKNDIAYWQGKEPKTSEELRKQIRSAVSATEDWLDAASNLSSEDRMLIYAQIFWLKQLLKLAHIEIKK